MTIPLQPELNRDYMLGVLNNLLLTPSPSGFCMEIMKLIREETSKLGYSIEMTAKGNAIITIPGTDSPNKHVAPTGINTYAQEADAGTLELAADAEALELAAEAETLELAADEGTLALEADAETLELAADEGTLALEADKGTLELAADAGTLALTAHVDTLGAMVRSINPNGMLRFTPIGGYAMHTVEGEYCLIHTRDGLTYEGTVLSTKTSVHVHSDARDWKREEANMEIRIDAAVKSKEETEQLGISPGDFISWEPRTRILSNGWVKSRHLDDKASVAALFGLMEWLKRVGQSPVRTVKIIISTYEEVGHGSSYIPPDITELIAVDMGAIGDDLSTTELDVSICAKDSTGPYDYNMTSKLIELAKREKIPYAVDVYPYYGSDASAALRGGSNIRAALIGPGVHASHGMERTHADAIVHTAALLLAYILEA